MFDDAVPGGNISKPLMLALGALLVGKMMNRSDSQAPQPDASQAEAPQNAGGGGLLGGLLSQASGMFGQATGGGGMMGGGGLIGGLSGLLEQFNQAGHGQVANSWVGTGPNQPIQPDQLGSALGQTTVSDLARHAGISEQELLAGLSRVLPGVVDKLTPGGQVPNQGDLSSMFNRQG
ncbi:MAG TPA: YidB family protein [Rhodopila sp.]|nr:YidB family protein [Rhodopila sp.]